MAISTKAIKSKIGSVKNIRKITKAMELVSASKMKRAVVNALATREYASTALDVLVNISKQQHISNSLLKDGRGKKVLVVIIASDKGLCGGYNVSLGRAVNSYLKFGGSEIQAGFITVGKKAGIIAKKTGKAVVGSFDAFSESVTTEDMRGLTKLIFNEFSSGEYKKVVVAYTHYVSAIRQEPKVQQVLPISKENVINIIGQVSDFSADVSQPSELGQRDLSLYLFEPNEEEVLDVVLPRLVEANIFQFILESLASEHSARMMAMKNANDNANELLDDLALTFNRARQASITQEISEISSGASALQS